MILKKCWINNAHISAHHYLWVSNGHRMKLTALIFKSATQSEKNTGKILIWSGDIPITLATHQDNSGYLKRMRPGRFDPDQWVAEHPVTPRIPTTSL
jgi:hypothetical protein